MNVSPSKLEWCIVRLGEDYNWWVNEVSDDIHWDVDRLGILDPNQVEHMADLLLQMESYGLRNDIVENAFFKFTIEKELPKNFVRLVSTDDEVLSPKEKIFALPNAVDEGDGPYIDFLDHITAVRVKMLNANLDFQQPLKVEEIEEVVRDEHQKEYMGGKSIHVFDEIISILDYVPLGYVLDLDVDDKKSNLEDGDVDLPEFNGVEDSEYALDVPGKSLEI